MPRPGARRAAPRAGPVGRDEADAERRRGRAPRRGPGRARRGRRARRRAARRRRRRRVAEPPAVGQLDVRLARASPRSRQPARARRGSGRSRVRWRVMGGLRVAFDVVTLCRKTEPCQTCDTVSTSSRSPRVPSAEARERILAAARTAARQRPFADLTVDALMAEAGPEADDLLPPLPRPAAARAGPAARRRRPAHRPRRADRARAPARTSSREMIAGLVAVFAEHGPLLRAIDAAARAATRPSPPGSTPPSTARAGSSPACSPPRRTRRRTRPSPRG